MGVMQALAALLSDGSLAVIESIEADFWEETLDSVLESRGTDDMDSGLSASIATLPDLRQQFVQ